MTKTGPTIKFSRPRTRKIGLSLLLIFALVFLNVPVKKAQAWPFCETACGMTAEPSWALHQSIVEGGLEALDEWIWFLMSELQSALVKYANQGSNDQQNIVTSMSALNDHVEQSSFAADRSEAVVDTALQIRPSVSACATNQATTKAFGAMLGLSSDSFLPDAGTSARSAMSTAESTVYNATWSNAPGTAGQNGRLAYLTDRYQNRIARYNNQDSTGLTTSASIAPDADLTPVTTILTKLRFDNADEETAAEDSVFNLMGDAVSDSIRGNILVRSDGRTQFLLREQEKARLNLASTILTGLVERRRVNAETGKSELELNADAAAFVMTPNKALDEGSADSEQSKSANLDKVISMVGDASRQLFVLQTYMEQWAAIKAVGLAMDIKSNSARGAGVGTRTILQP